MSRDRLLALPLLGALAFAALLSGCGAGDDGPSQDVIRQRLQSALDKLGTVRSLEASTQFEIETGEEDFDEEDKPCLNIRYQNGHPFRFETTAFDVACEGGSEATAVIVVGNRLWSSSGPDGYTEARVDPKVVRELTADENDKFEAVLEGADDFEFVPDQAAYSTPQGDYVEAPLYRFSAPADTLSDIDGAGDVDVEFEAVIDREGYLRELKVEVGEEDVSVTLIQLYEDINQPQEIGRPDPSEVNGPTQNITTEEQLQELIAPPTG